MLPEPIEGKVDLYGGDDRHLVHLLQVLFHGAALHLEDVLVSSLQLECRQLLGIPVDSNAHPPLLTCSGAEICMMSERFSICDLITNAVA